MTLPYIKRLPGDDVKDQVYATFFSAASRDVIARELGRLPEDVRGKVMRHNVIRLYDLRLDGKNN